MADTIFQKAWGNYVDLINFLLNADANGETQTGIFQPFNLATLFSYSKGKNNYNNFLLTNLSNFVAPTKIVNTNEGDGVLRYPSKLENGYKLFLNEFNDYLLNKLDPSKKPDLNALRNELKEAQFTFQNYQAAVQEKWITYARTNNIPVEKWENEKIIWERDNGYTMELDRYKDEIRATNVKINAFIRKNTPRELWTLIDSIAYFDDSGFQVKLPPSPVFDDLNKTSYWSPYRMQFPIVDIDEFLTGDNVISHFFESTSEAYSRIETKWNAKASFGWGLWSGGGNVEKRNLEEISQNSHFRFEISFKRFQNIEIFRSGWFQDALFTTIGKEFPAYWGPGGLLAAIPYSIVMARGTHIKVTMSDEYRKAVEAFISSGGSFGWGPFKASAGYTRDEKYMNYTKNANGFELTDSDQTVRIIGACLKRFNWDEQRALEYNQNAEPGVLKTRIATLESKLAAHLSNK